MIKKNIKFGRLIFKIWCKIFQLKNRTKQGGVDNSIDLVFSAMPKWERPYLPLPGSIDVKVVIILILFATISHFISSTPYTFLYHF